MILVNVLLINGLSILVGSPNLQDPADPPLSQSLSNNLQSLIPLIDESVGQDLLSILINFPNFCLALFLKMINPILCQDCSKPEQTSRFLPVNKFVHFKSSLYLIDQGPLFF